MTRKAYVLADHARMLVGRPYRLGGQRPEHGFDCIGLVRHCLQCAGCSVTQLPPYRLRNTGIAAFEALARHTGLYLADGPVRAGDILVVEPSCNQFHLAIAETVSSAIHAHAGLRRIVASPLPLPWPVVAIWRLDETGETSWQHSS